MFIYAYWCPTRIPYQMMFVSFNSNMTDVTSEAGIAYSFGVVEFVLLNLKGFFGGSRVRASQSLVFCLG